jgi:PAS domain S-box-containing protein
LAAAVTLSNSQGLDYSALTKPQLIERLQERDLRLDELNEADFPRGSDLEFLKQADHLLKKITDALPVLISYMDNELRYRGCNKTYETWRGLPREKIIGSHLKDVIGDAAYEVIRAYVERALSGKTVVYEDTLPYARGEVRNTHEHYQPDFDENGNVKGIFVSITDITELKNSEKALQELLGELEVRVWQRTAELQNAIDGLQQKALEQEQWATASSETMRGRSRLCNCCLRRSIVCRNTSCWSIPTIGWSWRTTLGGPPMR